jgi:pilus assembly protein CpaD
MTFKSLQLALSLAGAAAVLAACAPDRAVTGSAYPYDYRDRHPIVLAKAPETLDVFVAGGGLDQRQEDDLRVFAATYRRYGQGPITAELPAGVAAARRALPAVKAALEDAGLPAGRVAVRTYPVVDPGLAAPIRLSFPRLTAEVASRCGLWPQDLGLSNVKANANNEPYWNLGCAMQTNVAAQVADPVDLVRGRAEGRVDTVRRQANFEKLRNGQDPSTTYRSEAKTISNVGN